jgi:hypothetical protein
MDFGTLIIRVLYSTIEIGMGILLSLTMFRFPLRYNLHKVAIIALSMSTASIYSREIAQLQDFALLTLLSIETILIMILFNLPFFYSIVLSVIGYFLCGLVEYAVITVSIQLGLTSFQQISTSLLHSGTIYLVTSLIFVLFILILQSRKYGFVFMANWLSMKKALKGYNFVLSATLLICIVTMQLTSLSVNKLNFHFIIIIVSTILLLFTLIFAYKHNRRLIKEKYERLKNR